MHIRVHLVQSTHDMGMYKTIIANCCCYHGLNTYIQYILRIRHSIFTLDDVRTLVRTFTMVPAVVGGRDTSCCVSGMLTTL